MKNKLYFRGEDATTCVDLESFLTEARDEGFRKIELFEAVPDRETKDHVFCKLYEDVIGRKECVKSYCGDYKSKSGRGTCEMRGKLYRHGDNVIFILGDDENWTIKPPENGR